ncbi:MAG: hypothetical protein HY438_03800 [DPANN group archaeon]|nr:hypothetical protein [DPANN group archaeon]
MVKFQYVVLGMIYAGLLLTATLFITYSTQHSTDTAARYAKNFVEGRKIVADEQRAFEEKQAKEKIAEEITPEPEKPKLAYIPPSAAKINYTKGLIFNPRQRQDWTEVIAKAKGLNANLAVIEVELEKGADDNPEIYWYPQWQGSWQEETKKIVNEAHKNGMQTELRLGTRVETDVRDGPITDNETDYYRNATLRFFTNISKFANEYKIDRLAIYGEIDNLKNWGHRTEQINLVLQDVRGEIRKYYRGKIGVGFSSVILTDRKLDFDISGYDYVLFSAYATDYNTDFGSYENRVYETFKAAKKMAGHRLITDVTAGQLGVYDKNDTRYDYVSVIVSEKEEAGMWDSFFSRFGGEFSGFTIGCGTYAYSVCGEKSEAVVKDWFGKLPVPPPATASLASNLSKPYNATPGERPAYL